MISLRWMKYIYLYQCMLSHCLKHPNWVPFCASHLTLPQRLLDNGQIMGLNLRLFRVNMIRPDKKTYKSKMMYIM